MNIDLRELSRDEQTEAICITAIEQDYEQFRYVYQQTEAICLVGIQRGVSLIDVKDKTKAVCLAAVISDYFNLCHLKEQTYDLCLAAVNSHGEGLVFVENQTDEICLAAVRNNGMALEYVENQTDEICEAAIAENWGAVDFMKAPWLNTFKNAMDIDVDLIGQFDFTIINFSREWVDVINKALIELDPLSTSAIVFFIRSDVQYVELMTELDEISPSRLDDISIVFERHRSGFCDELVNIMQCFIAAQSLKLAPKKISRDSLYTDFSI